MLKIMLVATITLFFTISVRAQETANTRAAARGSSSVAIETKAQEANGSTEVATGTQLRGELVSAIDARKTKPGDEVKLRVIEPVMVGGKRVINKGAMLLGRVTEATKAEGKQGVSQVKLAFNELRHKDVTLPFSATLEQITRANVQGNVGDDAMMQSSSRSTTRSSTQSGAGGGLLGGAGGTVNNTLGGIVGGVTDTTSGTVNIVTGTSRQTLGQVIAVSSDTVSTTADNASGLIRISSDTNAQAEGNSTLSLTGRDVKIEKGAVFLLRTEKALAITAQR
jgi:hypothetical protein